MFLRSACAAAAMIAATALPAGAETPSAICEPASLRIYFEHGSDTLTPVAVEALNAAARNVAGCAYTELHVAVESGVHARRGEAVLAAMNGQGWNLAQVDQRQMTRVTYTGAPEFVEVTMAPYRVAVPVAPTIMAENAGV